MMVAGLLVGCGDDGGGQTPDASTGTDPDTGPELTTTATEGMTTSGGETTGSSATTGVDSSSGGDELPDYADSPCWGDASATSVYNGATHMTEMVATTCRAEGDRVMLHVADSLWENTVGQEEINGLMHRLEIFSPEGSVDPYQGVVLNDETVFGALDVASFPDGKLEIFVIDSNGGGDGYLCGWCSFPQLHLDGVVLQQLADDYSVGIAAHETYHVIHRARDENETQWVDESLAEAAMTANGLFTDVDWLDDFLADPDQNWGPGGPELGGFNYGAALLWGTFLWERGGVPLMTAITEEPSDDWAGLDAALDTVGDDREAFDLYLDMIVATYVDDPAAGYGFESFDFMPVAEEIGLMLGMLEMGTVEAYGIDYYPVLDTGSLTLNLMPSGPEAVIGQAILIGDGTVEVQPIGNATVIDVAAGQSLVIAVTARGPAGYTVGVD